jgi:hypothetical protein
VLVQTCNPNKTGNTDRRIKVQVNPGKNSKIQSEKQLKQKGLKVWPKWSATASKCETLSPNPNHTKKKRKKEKKRGAKSKANQPEGLVMKALGKLKRTE